MIPYSYNMVDMGGIDLAEANGTVVDGLYAKIVEAVNACGDVVLYNWKFAGIEITPQYTSILIGDPIIINGTVQVTEQDLVTVPGINPDPPVLVNLTAVENAVYYPVDYDADGFSSAEVNVPHPPPVIQRLDATSNGIYYPPAGVDGYNPVAVDVPVAARDLANWNFKESLVDSVLGLEAQLQNATRDQNGVSISSASSYISLPPHIAGWSRTYEIGIGEMSLVGTGQHRFFMLASGSGLIYRDSGKWSLYASGSGWAVDSNITAYDFFANSVMKIFIDIDGYWHIYKDNELVYETNIAYMNYNIVTIGASAQSAANAVIESLRVY